MAFPIKNFSGKINNKNTTSFLKNLDIGLCQKDRINLINDLLYTQHENNGDYLDSFYETYFDKKYKFNPSQDDYLSTENNVCKSLEKMANYILFSPDAEKTQKIKYSILKPNDLFKKYKCVKPKMLYISDLIEEEYNTGNYVDIIIFLLSKKNYKKQISQNIYSEDLKIPTIKQYQDYKDIILKKLKILKDLHKENKSKDSYKDVNFKNRIKLCSISSSIKSDQIDCKDMLKGTIYFKRISPESCCIDYDEFDFLNFNHVKELLSCNSNLTTDLGCLVYDLKNIISKLNLDNFEKEIIMLLNNDISQEEISERLNITNRKVKQIISKICNKVIKQYFKDLEDWYYLNISKGKYKKCSKCGEIKIATKSNFSPDNSKKDNYKSICKKCR